MEQIKKVLHVILDDVGMGEMGSELYGMWVLYRGGLFLAAVSLLLTLFNVVMGYWFMMGTTAFLVAGFVCAAVFARLKHFDASRFVMALICAVNFSIYAVTGGNEGFAILWITLIPIASMLLIGLRAGFFLSLYFQLFLVLLFYTPLNSLVSGDYTQTFAMRFPVLYFTIFALVTVLMYQRQRLYIKTNYQATHDALTGLMNRYRSREIAAQADAMGPDACLSVACLDINRLKYVNDTLGHLAGDELLVEGARLIQEAFAQDACFRIGGDEFLVISHRADLSESVRELRSLCGAWRGELADSLSFAVGIASRAQYPLASFLELNRAADKLMYQDKTEFYKQGGFDRRQNS